MKKLYQRILAGGLVTLTLLAMPLWTHGTMSKEGKSTFTESDLKRMSIFVSNFTELRFMNFTADAVLDPNNPEDAVFFGIWHNYINNNKSRIKQCQTKECKWGSMVIEGKHVTESLKKYFGSTVKLVSTHQKRMPFHYDGAFYHFDGADGEITYNARVHEAEENTDGTITMRGKIYNIENVKDVFGTFEAVARPHIFNEKHTWVINRMTTSAQQ